MNTPTEPLIPRPQWQGPPRPHRARWIRVGIVVVAAIVAIGLACLTIILTPTDRGAAKKLITVTAGEGVSELAQNLKQEGIIRYPGLFTAWTFMTGSAGRVQAGSYEVTAAYSYEKLRQIITSGEGTRQRVTIPEGWTIAEIAAQLAKQGIADPTAFTKLASQAGNFPEFTGGPVADQALEGYLFPDTYFFPPRSEPAAVIRTMLADFQTRTKPLQPQIAKSGMGLAQIITLASIVEREARTPADRRIVAGIFHKRLAQGIALQSDVTSLYELGDFHHTLTAEDLARDTPYNTRIHPGLPPTPIGNPGIDPIRAVLEPTETAYLYFIADKSGVMHYARTQAEHDANVAKYLR